MYVAPKIVSGRVVKTRISVGACISVVLTRTAAVPADSAGSKTTKRSSAPSERPIQFRCAVFVLSDQSIASRLSSSRPA